MPFDPLLTYFDPMLTRAEVATYFHVHPKTVTKWAKTGVLPSIRTPGGHRRFRLSDVEALATLGKNT